MAVVKATVFYIGDKIAVCRINDPDGTVWVAEASVGVDGAVQVLAHTMRRVTVRTRVNVLLDDVYDAQDETDRLALQIRRFRLRLKQFERSLLGITNSGRVRAQARAAARELEEFVS